MHTLARIPAREARLNRQTGNRAFTLIELLTVIGIIAILAAITFGVVKGVNERAAIGQAKAELASLAQALESYKLQYGDYPQVGSSVASPATSSALGTTTPYYLFNTLAGNFGPKLNAIAGKQFVDLARFSLETTNLPTSAGNAVSNSFLDPWGRRYIYYYRGNSGAAWTGHSGYILFSTGPDGSAGFTVNSASGKITISGETNIVAEADNIYSGSRPLGN